VANDRRLHLKAVTEREYYESQTQGAGPIKALGIFISVLMAIGACFAAMNAMYAAVGRRTKEIGILLALGFSRESVLLSFIVESVLLAAVGGICGCLLALPINGLAAGTMNFVTFSEVAFSFRVYSDALAEWRDLRDPNGLVGRSLPRLASGPRKHRCRSTSHLALAALCGARACS
jgi:putative ABC transport system permease protein